MVSWQNLRWTGDWEAAKVRQGATGTGWCESENLSESRQRPPKQPPPLDRALEWRKANDITSLKGRLLGKGVLAWLTRSLPVLPHFRPSPELTRAWHIFGTLPQSQEPE